MVTLDDSQNTTGVYRFDSMDTAGQYLSACAGLAIRHIDIFSNQLDGRLFNQPAFIANVSLLARNSRQSRIRVLVQNSQPLHGCNHDLIALIQRLPSAAKLKVLNKDHPRVETGFCISDRKAMVFFNNEENAVGFYCEQARAEARHALEAFENLWQSQSDIDPEFKTFTL